MTAGNSILRRLGALGLFAGIAVVFWIGLGRLGNEVNWLTLEGPQHLVAGTETSLRVRTPSVLTNGFLCVDLHWARDRNAPMGFLAAGQAQALNQADHVFEFTIPVPAKDQLHFVNAILYLSPDGSWSNHTFVATTSLLPVTNTIVARASGLEQLPLFRLEEAGPALTKPKSGLLRWLTGIVWLCGAALLGWKTWQNRSCATKENTAQRWWLALAVGFALAGLWELAGLEQLLGNWARTVARAEDVYFSRGNFQKVAISVIFAAAFGAIRFGWRQRESRLLPLSFAAYVTIAVVNLLSLHALDQVTTLAWRGLVLVDGLKLLCAAVAVYSLCIPYRKPPVPTGSPPISPS